MIAGILNAGCGFATTLDALAALLILTGAILGGIWLELVKDLGVRIMVGLSGGFARAGLNMIR